MGIKPGAFQFICNKHLAPLGQPPQEYWKAITHKGVLAWNRLKVNNRKSQESTMFWKHLGKFLTIPWISPFKTSGLIFHEVGPYHTETCLKICRANQWTGFYMIRTCIMKELNCQWNTSREMTDFWNLKWERTSKSYSGAFYENSSQLKAVKTLTIFTKSST